MNLKAYVCFNGGPFTYVTRHPNWNNDGVGQLNNGTEITVINEQNGWYQILFEDSTAWIPVSRVFFPLIGITTNNNPNESMPSTSSNPFACLHKNGTAVTIIGECSLGYKILFNGSITYLDPSNVRIGKKGYILFKDGPFTYVTRHPNWNNDGVGQLYNGTEVFIVGEQNGWYQILFEDSTAWVPTPRVYCPKNFIALNGTIQTNGSNSCNIQRIPSYDSNQTATKYSNGTFVHIIGENNGWYHIINGTSTGWVPYSNVSVKQKAYVCFKGGPFTYVTRHPNWNNDGVGQLNNGTEITIIGEQNGWFEISFNNGSAWVPVERLYIPLTNFIPLIGTITKETTIQSASASDSNLSIRRCNVNEDFTIINQANGWYQILFEDSTAWIPCANIETLTFKA